jgi:hypothetical protein
LTDWPGPTVALPFNRKSSRSKEKYKRFFFTDNIKETLFLSNHRTIDLWADSISEYSCFPLLQKIQKIYLDFKRIFSCLDNQTLLINLILTWKILKCQDILIILILIFYHNCFPMKPKSQQISKSVSGREHENIRRFQVWFGTIGQSGKPAGTIREQLYKEKRYWNAVVELNIFIAHLSELN